MLICRYKEKGPGAVMRREPFGWGSHDRQTPNR